MRSLQDSPNCRILSDPVGRENTALETNDSANGLISHRLSSEGRGDTWQKQKGKRKREEGGEAIFVQQTEREFGESTSLLSD